MAARQNNLSRESSDGPYSSTAPTHEWTSSFGEPPVFDVSHVTQPVVPEDVGEVPGFADDLLGSRAHEVSPVFAPDMSSA